MLNCQVLIEKSYLIENHLKKLNSFDLGYFIGKSHFDEDGAQNYLVSQPIQLSQTH